MLYKQFGSVELALAAYNAGPGNVACYKGMPPFKETKIFVNQIMTEYRNLKNNPDPAIIKYREINAKKAHNVLKPQQTVEVKAVESENNVENNNNEQEAVNLKDLLSRVD